jgi:hypothetical protein
MMTRIFFYLAESFLLALVCGAALVVAARALRRLGLTIAVRRMLGFLVLWAALFAIGVVGGELVGPEFLAAYRLTGVLVAFALLLWCASLPLSRVIYIDYRRNDDVRR